MEQNQMNNQQVAQQPDKKQEHAMHKEQKTMERQNRKMQKKLSKQQKHDGAKEKHKLHEEQEQQKRQAEKQLLTNKLETHTKYRIARLDAWHQFKLNMDQATVQLKKEKLVHKMEHNKMK